MVHCNLHCHYRHYLVSMNDSVDTEIKTNEELGESSVDYYKYREDKRSLFYIN
jgi:hypothetical protein